MDRIYNILNNIQNQLKSAQKTYDGKKRNDLKNSDFLFPETKSFPIVSPSDVKDAISNYGRMRSNITYEAFLRKLYNFCKRKGPEFVAALPEASKEKLNLKTDKSSANDVFDLRALQNNEDDSSIIENEELIKELYDMSLSSLKSIYVHVNGILNAIDHNMDVKDNLTEAWLQGKIAVVADYIRQIHDFLMFSHDSDDSDDTDSDDGTVAKKTIKKKKAQKLFLHNLPFLHYSAPTTNVEHQQQENEEKEQSPNSPPTQNDTEEDSESPSAMSKTGLWDNIRKKKQREGKNYKPAKTQKEGRPDPDTWKKLTDNK